MPTVAFDLFFVVSSVLGVAAAPLINDHHCSDICSTDRKVRSTLRDLQSSHETLNGLDSLCLLRLPDASAPSISEASSSPLHASSSPCSAALPGELSVSFWFIVGLARVGAGEKEPSWRMLGLIPKSFPATSRQVPLHAHTAEAPAAYGRTSSSPNNVVSRVSVFDGWVAHLIAKVSLKVYLADCPFAVLSHCLSRPLNCDCFVCSL